MDQNKVEVNIQLSLLKIILVNKGFDNIRQTDIFFLQDQDGKSRTGKMAHFSYSDSQSEHRICFILPMWGFSHIIINHHLLCFLIAYAVSVGGPLQLVPFFLSEINSYGLASMVLIVPSLAYCKHTCFNPVFYVFLLSSITYSYLSKEKSWLKK